MGGWVDGWMGGWDGGGGGGKEVGRCKTQNSKFSLFPLPSSLRNSSRCSVYKISYSTRVDTESSYGQTLSR
ncbi:hypothetical protein E1H13_09650 [Nodosilinea sp. P-1105]|nr:hypothetical protein [Nodosilinea sp. P-1105]